MKPVAVVDGANVALQEKTSDGKAKVQNLTKMRKLLDEKGYKIIIISDASLRYGVDDIKQYDHLDDEGVILEAPAGTEADYFVLVTAQQQDGIVVSNDLYGKYIEQFPWIKEKRVPFMIVDGDIILYCPDMDKEHCD